MDFNIHIAALLVGLTLPYFSFIGGLSWGGRVVGEDEGEGQDLSGVQRDNSPYLQQTSIQTRSLQSQTLCLRRVGELGEALRSLVRSENPTLVLLTINHK